MFCAAFGAFKIRQNSDCAHYWPLWWNSASHVGREDGRLGAQLDNLLHKSELEVTREFKSLSLTPAPGVHCRPGEMVRIHQLTGSLCLLRFRGGQLHDYELQVAAQWKQPPVRYWNVVERPRRSIAKYGVWLWLAVLTIVFIPPGGSKVMSQVCLATALVVAECRFLAPCFPADVVAWDELPVAAGMVLSSIVLVAWMHRRNPWPDSSFCSHCSYDLTGNISGVCPECGAPVERRVTRAIRRDITD